MADRQSARLFQGAHISLGGIKNLDRALIDYRPEELAYIVGYFMFQNSEAGLSADGNIYRGSIGYVIRQTFPMQDEPPKSIIKNISFYLRQNGFRAIGAGQQFLGWLVPNDLSNWIEPTERKVVIETDKVVVVNPVKTMWACQFGCDTKTGPLGFESRFARDKHHEIVHNVITHKAPEEKGTDVMSYTCEICGKDVKSIQGLGIHKRYVHKIEGKNTKHPIVDGKVRATPSVKVKVTEGGTMQGTQPEIPGVTPAPAVATITEEKKIWKCAECGMEFPSSALMASHVGHTHRNAEWTCSICGKTMQYAGKGGHMRTHRLSVKQKMALDAIKDRPGRHPSEYATALGFARGTMSGLAMQLKKRGLVTVTGHTQGSRYYPDTAGKNAKSGRGAKPIAAAIDSKSTAKPEEKKPKSGFRKQSVTQITSSDVRKVVLIGDDVLIEDGEVYKITKTKVS